jgi:hypothetical protein
MFDVVDPAQTQHDAERSQLRRVQREHIRLPEFELLRADSEVVAENAGAPNVHGTDVEREDA